MLSMPKGTISYAAKAKAAQLAYPKEFFVNSSGRLNCKLCGVTVCADKAFNYESHRKSQKHQNLLNASTNQQPISDFKPIDESSWPYEVTKAFLQSDIPLHKLNAEPLQKLFKSIKKPLPSQTNSWKCVDLIAESQMRLIKETVAERKVFLVVDESDIKGQKYVNSLIGTIDNPSVTYLVGCKPIDSSPNAAMICQVIDDILKDLSISRENFVLLLSDAARYMISAGTTLKVMYPNLFTVTCIAHLLHNCALRVKSHFQDVDYLIASIKAATVKNKSRRDLFREIGQPPQPVVTRWGSWIEAALYYAENIIKVTEIVNSFEDDGVLVRKAKESLACPTLRSSLLSIYRCYSKLSELIGKLESTKYTIEDAIRDMPALDFGEDVCGLKLYLDKRLESNEIFAIHQMKNQTVSPKTYALLLNCQPTSCSVERSFSLLGKLLAKDRNFNVANVQKYICVLYNKFLDF